MTQTVMAKADEILAKMGISDSVPLAEASTESLHSVGKKYDEDLPQIDDTQRLALLEACGVVDSDKTEIDDTDDTGSDSVPEADEEISIKFKPARKLKKANPKAKPTKENPVVIVADHKTSMISKALEEMTGVGSIGVNMAGAQADPMKPKKKKSRKLPKGDKATDKFLSNTFKEL
tara:strand:+ start:275 stop:802 length:528 start_codon:yes stop_codon:yes gene_type:complete